MSRAVYLVLAFPLFLALFLLPDFSGLWSVWLNVAAYLLVGLFGVVVVFLRLPRCGMCRAWAVFPVLPFLYLRAMQMFSPGRGAMVFFLALLFFLVGGFVAVRSVVPDVSAPGERRLDAVSIMLSVFIAYYVVTECASLFFR